MTRPAGSQDCHLVGRCRSLRATMRFSPREFICNVVVMTPFTLSAFQVRVGTAPESNPNRAQQEVIVPAPGSRSGCLRKRNSPKGPANPQIGAALLIALYVSLRLQAVPEVVAQGICRSELFPLPGADRDPPTTRGNGALHQ